MERPPHLRLTVNSACEAEKIPDRQASEATRFLFETSYYGPVEQVRYESEVFSRDRNGKTESTIPDLHVLLKRKKNFYLELTNSDLTVDTQPEFTSIPIWLEELREEGQVEMLPLAIVHDPKARQKRVMRAWNVDYRVWYRSFMDTLQEQFPNYHFIPVPLSSGQTLEIASAAG